MQDFILFACLYLQFYLPFGKNYNHFPHHSEVFPSLSVSLFHPNPEQISNSPIDNITCHVFRYLYLFHNPPVVRRRCSYRQDLFSVSVGVLKHRFSNSSGKMMYAMSPSQVLTKHFHSSVRPDPGHGTICSSEVVSRK